MKYTISLLLFLMITNNLFCMSLEQDGLVRPRTARGRPRTRRHSSPHIHRHHRVTSLRRVHTQRLLPIPEEPFAGSTERFPAPPVATIADVHILIESGTRTQRERLGDIERQIDTLRQETENKIKFLRRYMYYGATCCTLIIGSVTTALIAYLVNK